VVRTEAIDAQCRMRVHQHRAEVFTRNALVGGMIVIGAISARAEQADSRPIVATAQLPSQPKLIIRSEDLFLLTHPTRLGMFTLVPPETNGEVIRIAIPVGELASKAARAISDARQRRAERKVDERIARELQLHFCRTVALKGDNMRHDCP
jgi:hypothetical protein